MYNDFHSDMFWNSNYQALIIIVSGRFPFDEKDSFAMNLSQLFGHA